MKKAIIPLEDADGKNTSLCGNKAAALTKLIKAGFTVPRGLCVSSKAYQTYIKKTGLREKILMELGRKRFEDMRWEEMWDASLRIRNMFLATAIPRQLEDAIRSAVEDHFQGKPVAVRSSSSLEDSSHSSFAGLHESYVNLSGADTIMHHLKLVWASLWSDSALSYRKELSLEIDKSSMSVIIQEMILGEKSGVAFGVHPQNRNQAVIESVYGLNKGLVDGDVEPDRWILDRITGKPVSITPAKRGKAVLPRKQGVGMEGLDPDTAQKPPLSEGEVEEVFNLVKTAEALFGAPQDVEWTIKEKVVYLLQSRPITLLHDENDRRSYDLSLRRTFGNLKGLAERIETVLVPQMIAESEALAIKDLKTMGEADLVAEIQQRKDLLDKWHEVYWEDFIPFGHGVRLFGQTYNERIKPADPYEFVALLTASDLKSVERNTMLADLAKKARDKRAFGSDNGAEIDEAFGRQLDSFIEKFSGTSCTLAKCTDERKSLLKLLQEMSAAPEKFEETVPQDKATLRVRYLKAFDQDEQEYARELLELGGKSYQMRDDDNIYLGRFETQLVLAVEESRKRLGAGCKDTYACANLEETARALKLNDEEPAKHESISNKEGSMNIKARQLRGQPAGPGIARGPARVVSDVQSLFEVKNGEILVCDAIDPNMTFVIPLVGGIIERRGGMLIHGAIIAREYGLPCVTGIPDATAFIKTGDFVVVDGYYGLVTIESKEQSSWTPAA